MFYINIPMSPRAQKLFSTMVLCNGYNCKVIEEQGQYMFTDLATPGAALRAETWNLETA